MSREREAKNPHYAERIDRDPTAPLYSKKCQELGEKRRKSTCCCAGPTYDPDKPCPVHPKSA